MFTKIFTRNYFLQTWLTVILVINGLEVLVMRPGRAQTYVFPEQPSTLETTQEQIINGTLNENSEQFEDNKRYFQKHTFTGKAGEAITIELNSSEFDAYLMLIDPKSNKIAENDDGGENNNAKITMTLVVTNFYLFANLNYYVQFTQWTSNILDLQFPKFHFCEHCILAIKI